ncbi:ThiF family adenylyltransferase [Larkinella bovis]|uniref:ThiF family adenylyltransferase n=1 Tax=Larkinella bovis TaxID=683041 RepID=A0ABW0IDP3_9BACT
MWWFKRHPDYFRQESVRLKQDANYQEHYQVLDNLFLSTGEVLVRGEHILRYAVLIAYSESTPYSLPSVFLLQRPLSAERLKTLAAGTFAALADQLADEVQFFYRRHQMPTGELCVLEADYLDNVAKFYPIDQVLHRVRDWLAGLTTGVFPPDSSEVELYTHFRQKLTSVEILYPPEYLDASVEQGDFYAVRVTYIPKGTLYLTEKTIYRGLFIRNQNKAGLFVTRSINEWHSFLPEVIQTEADLETKRPVIDQEIESGRLLRGHWFHLDHEPTPFADIGEFVELLGNGDRQYGYQRLFNVIGEQIKRLPDYIDIAVRYANRRGELEWQLFRLTKNTQTAHTLIGEFTPELLGQMLEGSYDQLAAIRSELLSDTSFHLRNQGRADRTALQAHHLVLLGCGSLGSEVADAIGKAGVGTVTLVDKEILHAHNVVRHLGGLEELGQAKVQLTGMHLLLHNPFISIFRYGLNVLVTPINEYMEMGAVGLSTIADDNVEGYLNEQAVISRHTIFYARALRGGKAARIFRVIPGQDACFHCLSLYAAAGDPRFVVLVEDPSLPTIVNECNNPVRPASAADLKLISALTSRLLLDHLQDRLPKDENHWLWSTEPDVPTLGAQPFTLQRGWLPPNPACPYCNEQHPFNLSLPNPILTTMRDEIAQDRRIETGGVLVGYKDEAGTVQIKAASGPGPKAIKQPRFFEKDIQFCQQFLDDQYERNRWVYLGEWHYHPTGDNKPSSTDLKSLSSIAQQKEYMTSEPVMIILDSQGQASCSIHPAGRMFYFVESQITPA